MQLRIKQVIQSLFEDLYNKNKYVIKIYTDDSDLDYLHI
jgi:hypothetical protein